jgi:hypothetical protein
LASADFPESFYLNYIIIYSAGKHKNETVTASVTVAELPTTQVGATTRFATYDVDYVPTPVATFGIFHFSLQPINSMILNGQLQTSVNGVNIQNGLATQINAKVRTILRLWHNLNKIRCFFYMRLTHSVEENILGERIDRGLKLQVTAWTTIRRNQSSLLTILESCFVFIYMINWYLIFIPSIWEGFLNMCLTFLVDILAFVIKTYKP